MPTILSVEGYLVRIYLNDHLPSHVHVIKDDGECAIDLMGKDGSPELREFYNLKAKEVAKAIAIVQENQAELIIKWKTIHGE